MIKVFISVLGHDRPGIIATVSSAISAHNGNIENVSQTLLQDVFGGLFIVALPDESAIESLRKDLHARCQPLNLVVKLDSYQPREDSQAGIETQPYVITANGPDRNGLVATLTACMLEHELNITNMHARFSGGNKRYDNVMIFEVDVPRATVMDKLRADLQGIGTTLGLEISIQHRRIFEAVSHLDR